MTSLPSRSLDRLSEEQKRALLRSLLARDEAAGAVDESGDSAAVTTGAGRVPLSSGQRGLWFLQELQPDSAAYNMAWPARADSALDADALRRAVLALMARHEALRTVVVDDEGGLWQETPASWESLLFYRQHDASTWSEAQVQARVDASYRRPFDLRRGPTVRLELFSQGVERHVLLLVVHHIFADAWSLQVMLRDLGALYEQEHSGTRARLPELAWATEDYVAWQRALLSDAERSGLWPRWRARLAGALPVLELPAAPPRTARQIPRGASSTFALSAELTAAIKQLARRRGSTVFVVLLSAFYALLHRLTRATDLLVGSPMAGRGRDELAEMVGYFVNLVPLRVQLESSQTFSELIDQVRQVVLAAMDDQEFPFDTIVERLRPERAAGRSPLLDALFEYRQPHRDDELLWLTVSEESAERVAFGGLTGVGRYPLRQQEGKFDLQLEMAELPSGICGVWKYRADLLDEEAIARMTTQLRVLLADATAAPERQLGALALVSDNEKARLVGLSRPQRRAGATPSIHAWFAATAAARGEQIVLIDGVEQLSYRELDRLASQVAHQLRARGVQPGQLIGLCVQRSFAIVIGELAILKAGAAFVPLDPSLPSDRLELYVRDAGLADILCHQATEAVVAGLPSVGSGAVSLLLLETFAGDDGGDRCDDGQFGIAEDAPAYVIYTSGSTGKPKGVVVTHRNVARLFLRTEALFGFSSSDVWSLFHSYAFDFSIWEIWGALLYGGRLVIVSSAASRSPEVFHALLRAEGVTVLNHTPSAFQELSQVDALLGGPSQLALRMIIFGGEALAPGALEGWMARHGDVSPQLVNMYGITETCVHVTYRQVTRRDLARPSRSPIGRPIDDLGLYVLDEHLAPVPVGVAGELYVGGDGVALGYLNRPALTAERFVPDPFAERPGQRLYRTGDLARIDPGSEELEYLGRIDSQVKIRGFRIELGEIEHVLRAHPAVRDAIVLPDGGGAGGEHLIAYVVPRREAIVASDGEMIAELLAAAAAAMPSYMVPAAVLMIDALPLNHNGKIDRGALPRWQREAGGEPRWQEPQTEAERALAAIWCELLGVARVGRHDRFFHIGGHSLLATRMILRVRQALGVEIPILAVFETPELSELAAQVDQAKHRAGPTGRHAPIGRVDRESELALGLAQQRLWFLDRLDAGNPVYNVPMMFRLRGPLSRSHLELALARIEERHEVLRTSYPLSAASGQPVQHIAAAGAGALGRTELALPVTSLSHLAEEEREREARRLATSAFHRPFDLERGAPWRGELIELGPDHHWLVLCAHHIALDGWSVGLLLAELVELLRAEAAGEPAVLPEVKVQYADFAQWQRRWQTADLLEPQLGYWKTHLSGAPLLLEIPGDHPRPPVQTFRGGLVPFALTPEQAEAVRALALDHGATPFMVLLAALEAWLYRVTGQRDLLVGSPVANRQHPDVDQALGCFVESVLFRARFEEPLTFAQLLAATRQDTLGAYAHQEVPFDLLVEALKPPRDRSRNPLFQIMFALQRTPGAAPMAGALRFEPLLPDSQISKLDLSLNLADDGAGFHGFFEYSSDLYERTSVEAFTRSFSALLSSALRDPRAMVDALSLLPEEERERVLVEWNPSAEPEPPAQTIASRFAVQLALRGEATCLVTEDDELCYREVAGRAVQLARRLITLGVGPEVRVGVCLPRTAALPIALLAVQLAGGACVPMDPRYPRERLSFMVEDSGMQVAIAGGAERAWISSSAVQVVDPDEASEEPAEEIAAEVVALAAAVPASALAYLIYTSGSTGRPKGVALGHGGISALVSWSADDYADADLQGVLASTSVCFDLSIFELFVPWGRGGWVILVDDLLALAHSALAHRVRLINTVPSAMTELSRMGAVPPSAAIINLAGEPIRQSLVDALYALGSVAHVYNLYGPTEDTVYSTGCRLVAGATGAPPIGRALRHGRAYVLDEALRPVPPGVIGELYLGGAGLARGYHARAAMTAERFLPDPHGPPGARMYRTGDFARWRRDGQLDFLGRKDGQVKLRGFRVELGEIEEALARLPGVREAAVLVHHSGDRLVAYVSVAEGAASSAGELRRRLQQTLPAHMVPASYALLAELPHTPNGKIDRRALQAAGADGSPSAGASMIPEVVDGAASELEGALRDLWKQLLEVPEVGLEDSFFDLGGHSLLLTRMHVELGRRFPGLVALGELFQAPTVRQLAALLTERQRGEAGDTLREEGARGRERAELRRRGPSRRRRGHADGADGAGDQ